MNILPGDILILNNMDGNFLSKSIRFFSGEPWSHTGVVFFPFLGGPETGNIFEADLLIKTTDWQSLVDDPYYDLRVYRWKNQMNISPALLSVFKQFDGMLYGEMMLLWFIWAWIVKKLHLPLRWAIHNFFPGRGICTKVVYVFLQDLHDMYVTTAMSLVGKDENTVAPANIMAICDELCFNGFMELVFTQMHTQAK